METTILYLSYRAILKMPQKERLKEMLPFVPQTKHQMEKLELLASTC